MKIALVGNSHLVAYKSAEEQIKQRYPDVELSFFSLHNQDFFRNAFKNAQGLPFDASKMRDGHAVIDQAGPDHLRFEAFERVFLTSHGFYLGALLDVLATYDILDLQPVGRNALISWPCVQDFIEARLRYYSRRLNDFFPLAQNVTIVQMPFPAEQALKTHPHLARAVEQPDLAEVFHRYTARIETQLASLDAAYQPIPEDLLAAPFVMQSIYARAKEVARPNQVRDADYTHMNAKFALRMFDAFLK